MIDSEYIKSVMEILGKRGVVFTVGLTEAQLVSIESAANGKLPSELRLLLGTAVPMSRGAGGFPDWSQGISSVMNKSYDFIKELYLFDVIEGGYWDAAFGERPDDDRDAIELVSQKLHQAPRLIPVYGHRFMIAGDETSPVLSYYGPLDTIIYGTNLADYFFEEFDIPNPDGKSYIDDKLDFWSRLL